ncbi:MAG: choice-of-anchor J domain-containing protein [Clostridiales bacterium]|nr:choice-of-anchor J domain-containing protein [Clostridiales bacterium]
MYSETFYDFSTPATESGWTFVDEDADGHNWLNGENGKKSHSSSSIRDGSVIYSQSFENNVGVYFPDNWAIAPAGLVDPAGSLIVSIWAIAERENYPDEHFAIYAAPEGADLVNFDPDEWTQISDEYVATGTWTEYSGDLSRFSGQKVYVAIRHFNCSDQYELIIDDVTIPFLDEMGEELYGYTLSLEGDIAVNFYMRLDDNIVSSSTAKMEFQIPNGDGFTTQTVMVSEVAANPKIISGKAYYVFKCRVSAKDMSSTITAQLMDGDQVGKTYSYSVKQYAEYILKHSGDYPDEAVSLVKTLMNYGAMAQIYFGVNTNSLANSTLTKEEKTAATSVTADKIKPYAVSDINVPNGVTFEGATLSLKSETTLSLYFTCDETLTFGADGMTEDGKTIEYAQVGNYQVARIRGINATELAKSFTVMVTCGETSGTVTYSPMTYCYNVVTGNSDEKLQNVCRTLYLLRQASWDYLVSQIHVA